MSDQWRHNDIKMVITSAWHNMLLIVTVGGDENKGTSGSTATRSPAILSKNFIT